ncbi:ABC transporter substrate-binding protein [Promicromonospora aerolata]|uniref:ABC transporter substrate-binding protein n=1 Tax=Promicromonospora aerolata TaxID=195749 RepID=A0ABW4VEI6_9MICO
MLSSTRPTRRAAARTLQATAGAAAVALALTACGGAAEGSEEGSGEDGPITLKVATFNDFGYTEEMLAEYTDEHPNVTVEHITAATTDDARSNMTTKLAAGGEGLADIEAIEVDWLPELMQYPDLFTDLADPALDGRWVDWKVQQATTPEGKVIGYGTDIGPEAICYRSDLFEEAGLPTDRAEVAELLGGESATWEDYFAAGREFVKKSDAAWYDSAAGTFQGMVNQLPAAFEDPESGEPKALGDNTEVKDIYDEITASVEDDLSAGLEQWGGDWDAGFQNDAFATMLCPAWMTGPIEERSGGVEGWDVADVFPGGGGNWGGSFLTVPASGENTEAAKELAAWLTDPAQQTKAFESAGTFPSQLEAQDSEAVQSFTNPFFNDAPVGEIFSTRAQNIDGAPYKGAHYFAIRDEVTNALNRVDISKSQDAQKSWDEAVEKAAALG